MVRLSSAYGFNIECMLWEDPTLRTLERIESCQYQISRALECGFDIDYIEQV